MNNHRCTSQKSLITIRKWLLEAGDGLLTSIYPPSSRFDHNVKQKSHPNKIIKRKRFNNHKSDLKPTSIIDWFSEFIKKVFTAYDENPLKSNVEIHHPSVDETTLSIMTCSTCQFENVDAHINTIQSTLISSKSSSALHSKTYPKIMVPTATSSFNLNSSQSIILPSSKTIQTQANYNEEQSINHSLYCFSIKDGQVLSLYFPSPSSTTVLPLVKEVVSSSSPLCISNGKSEYCDHPVDLPMSLLRTDIHSYSSYQPTVTSIPSSHSNIFSFQTTDNFFKEDDILSKVSRPSSSLHDTRIYHFDKYDCLSECYHSSNINLNPPEIVFAKSTCQLIKQAWL